MWAGLGMLEIIRYAIYNIVYSWNIPTGCYLKLFGRGSGSCYWVAVCLLLHPPLPCWGLEGAAQPGLCSDIYPTDQSSGKVSSPHHHLERANKFRLPSGFWEGFPLVSGEVHSYRKLQIRPQRHPEPLVLHRHPYLSPWPWMGLKILQLQDWGWDETIIFSCYTNNMLYIYNLYKYQHKFYILFTYKYVSTYIEI